MSFKDLYVKARKDQDAVEEYQRSKVEWLSDTLKVVEEVGLNVKRYHDRVAVRFLSNEYWIFKIETGSLWSNYTQYRWRPSKLGKDHRITITNRWDVAEEVIDQIEKDDEGLAELRRAIQTWLANEIVERKVDSDMAFYHSNGYME
jgi:hypothetical protein